MIGILEAKYHLFILFHSFDLWTSNKNDLRMINLLNNYTKLWNNSITIHKGLCGDLEHENMLIEFTKTTKQGATTRLKKIYIINIYSI